MDIIQVVSKTSWFSVIPAIIIIARYHLYQNKTFKILLIYFIGHFTWDLYLNYAPKLLDLKTVNAVNLYTIFQISVSYYLFISLSKKPKLLIPVALFLVLVTFVWKTIYGLNIYDSVGDAFAFFTIIIFCINYYRELYIYESNVLIDEKADFWIVSLFLIFSSGSFFYMMNYDYITSTVLLYDTYSSLYYSLNIFNNLSLALVALLNRKKIGS